MLFEKVQPHYNKHLMTGPEGNSEFCFPETLKENKEWRENQD